MGAADDRVDFRPLPDVLEQRVPVVHHEVMRTVWQAQKGLLVHQVLMSRTGEILKKVVTSYGKNVEEEEQHHEVKSDALEGPDLGQNDNMDLMKLCIEPETPHLTAESQQLKHTGWPDTLPGTQDFMQQGQQGDSEVKDFRSIPPIQGESGYPPQIDFQNENRQDKPN
ncbi:hypothetical protein H920_05568 [Fukomys damarensis]|uniref:Uncharacterized protein n=1 Tax=Fukomys damarensis TaxID=885580 RepID=A0A091DPE9_FUKDA|nr:hypothetical protein H920_05568 [Fukomys damarensis]